jgi:hypothetical protein
MRNISFSLTTSQFKARTKTVTRRLNWTWLVEAVAKAVSTDGERPRLMGCEKCMGRKAGEPLVRLGEIEVLWATREPLRRMIDEPEYGQRECIAEGFPDMTPEQFVAFFCKSHKGCTPDTVITRIQFRYV